MIYIYIYICKEVTGSHKCIFKGVCPPSQSTFPSVCVINSPTKAIFGQAPGHSLHRQVFATERHDICNHHIVKSIHNGQ